MSERAEAEDSVLQVMLPGSESVRALSEVASSRHDIVEARQALDAAANAEGATRRLLQFYAVVAFRRTYGSNVRRDLNEIIDLSEGDAALSARLRDLRNKAIAHSENDMTETRVVADLVVPPAGGVSVGRVLAITTATGMPSDVVDEFGGMLARVQEALDLCIEELKGAVARQFAPEELSAMVLRPVQTRMVVKDSREWMPATRRPAYPSDAESAVYMARSDDSDGSAGAPRS